MFHSFCFTSEGLVFAKGLVVPILPSFLLPFRDDGERSASWHRQSTDQRSHHRFITSSPSVRTVLAILVTRLIAVALSLTTRPQPSRLNLLFHPRIGANNNRQRRRSSHIPRSNQQSFASLIAFRSEQHSPHPRDHVPTVTA